jgi:hypothetical protein
METPVANEDSLTPMNKQKSCPVGALPSAPVGIVGTTVAPGGRSVTREYDPRLISDESVR